MAKFRVRVEGHTRAFYYGEYVIEAEDDVEAETKAEDLFFEENPDCEEIEEIEAVETDEED